MAPWLGLGAGSTARETALRWRLSTPRTPPTIPTSLQPGWILAMSTSRPSPSESRLRAETTQSGTAGRHVRTSQTLTDFRMLGLRESSAAHERPRIRLADRRAQQCLPYVPTLTGPERA